VTAPDPRTTPAWLGDNRTPEINPWAILLCKFMDTPEDSPTPGLTYSRLFTQAGSGTFNAVRYFSDVSHGLVDISGSVVFGWLTIDANHNDYTAPDPTPPGWTQKIGRAELTALARKAASNAGIPLKDYWGDVIIFNVAIGGAFGSSGVPYSPSYYDRPFACSDYRSTSTAIFSHEMGHAYGLNHSREDGSTDDYRDQWDIMSALNTYFAADPVFGTRGPGLNAANMRARSWWNELRVWRPSSSGFSEVIQLRPLFRRDLPGLLAAELSMAPGGFTVEYRKRTDWDAAIPRSAVLVHRYQQGNSYIMRGTTGQPDLVQGDKFKTGLLPYAANVEVEIMDIDDANDTASVKVSRTPATPLPPSTPTQFFGQIPFDGGGGILIDGKFIPVPPWNPMAEILRLIADLPVGERAAQRHLRNALTRQILVEVSARVKSLIEEIDSFGGPERNAPPFPTASDQPKLTKAKKTRTVNSLKNVRR
jgi:Peptidase M66